MAFEVPDSNIHLTPPGGFRFQLIYHAIFVKLYYTFSSQKFPAVQFLNFADRVWDIIFEDNPATIKPRICDKQELPKTHLHLFGIICG